MTALAPPWSRLKRSLVAILRGIEEPAVEGVVTALLEAGFEAIEIPLNSPDPFASIARAVRLAPAGCLIGAGTVLSPAEVDRLADIGGSLAVSPNSDPAVVARAVERGLVSLPGVMTPTEALAALKAGASALKFFPASLLGPANIQAIAAVLPRGTGIVAVGGVAERDFAAYAAAGIGSFGLGSSLFKPGMPAEEVGRRARAAVAAYDRLQEQGRSTH